MKRVTRKILIIFILMMSYVVISIICGNKEFVAFAVNQTVSTDINSVNSNQYPQIKEMLQTLKDQLWVVDSSQYETLGHIAIDSTNQVQLTFYYSNSYLIITVERIIEVKETLRLLPTDFSSQSYAANEGEVTIQEIRFTCHNVMNQQGKIQIKKSNNDEDSYFYNNDALNLVSLQLENLFGSPTIYGCYSAGDYTNGVAIEADENGVYSLYSFNYFCIVSGTGVTTMSELIIELA